MKWTRDLAYAVGLITADGNLSKDGRHLSLVSKDKDQIKTFAKILNLKNRICRKGSSYSSEKKYFHVQFGNVKFYRDLVKIGLMSRKSKRLGTLKIPKYCFPDFLRGYFDGDGFTHSYWDPRWRSSFMLYLGFSSGSKAYLNWLKDKIQNFYQVYGVIKPGRRVYVLLFAKKSSLSLLKKMYYHPDVPCLRRKMVKIQKSLDIINKE